MKTLVFCLFPILIFACKTDSNPAAVLSVSEYRQLAWEHLAQEEKETVTGDWREARVDTCAFPASDQEAVCVYFNTIHDSLLGPIVVFISPETKKVLGMGLRW